MAFISNIKASFATDAAVDAERDRGDLVQTLLLVAGFAVATLLAVNWLSTSLLNKAADAASCIEGSNTYKSDKGGDNCESVNHAEDNSFTEDKGYSGRFGSGSGN